MRELCSRCQIVTTWLVQWLLQYRCSFLDIMTLWLQWINTNLTKYFVINCVLRVLFAQTVLAFHLTHHSFELVEHDVNLALCIVQLLDRWFLPVHDLQLELLLSALKFFHLLIYFIVLIIASFWCLLNNWDFFNHESDQTNDWCKATKHLLELIDDADSLRISSIYHGKEFLVHRDYLADEAVNAEECLLQGHLLL